MKLKRKHLIGSGVGLVVAALVWLGMREKALEVDTEEFKPKLNAPGPIQGCKVCGSKLVMIRGRIPHQPDREVCACCAVEKLEEMDFQKRMAEQGPCQASL